MKSCVAALLLLSSSALAHQPHFNAGSPSRERAWLIEPPDVSRVITAQARGAGLDWYRLTVPAGFRLDAAVFVGGPCDAAFQPKLWLIGRGLPTQNVPAFVPAGWGAVRAGDRFAEYLGHGVVGRKGRTLERSLPAGTYELVVEHSQTPGWYFLSLGGREVGGGTPAGRAALARFNRCG